jgi:hypothetical protein
MYKLKQSDRLINMRLSRISFLSIFLFAQFFPGAQIINAAVFTDVNSSNEHIDAITFAQKEGIVGGYPDGTFRPNATINRAEFVKMLIGYIYKDQQTMLDMCRGVSGSFSDVPRDAWYGHYLCRATDDHIVGGYPDKTFHPDQPITFAEASKMIAEGMTRIVQTSEYNGDTYNGFHFPQKTSGTWYEGYINWLADYKAIPTDIQKFDQQMSRGQVAEVFYRLVNKLSKESQTYDSIGNISWFSKTNVCTDPPTRGPLVSSSALVFPVKKEFLLLGYLGELFTAEDCGSSYTQRVCNRRTT